MGSTITYTLVELDLLCRAISSNFDRCCLSNIRKIIKSFNNPNNSLIQNDEVIYSTSLGMLDEFKNYEPYGEGKVFVLYYSMNSLEFYFCTRHLKRFLFDFTLYDMPLLINIHFISVLATWRLKISK